MSGLQFINMADPVKGWSVEKIAEIAGLVDAWCKAKGINDAVLETVEDNTWSDTRNKRMDIEIRYPGKTGWPIRQKLLILNGEVIDGKTFHERFDEFYPKKEVSA